MPVELHREAELDDHNYQVREVYAQFGLALYNAQVLEKGLLNALTVAQTIAHEVPIQSTFDQLFESNLTSTMGKLMKDLKPFLGEDTELRLDLWAALKLRNRLAHSFFWDHASAFMSVSGRETMLAELLQAQTTFQALDERVKPVVARYLSSFGVSEARQTRLLTEYLLKLRHEAKADDE